MFGDFDIRSTTADDTDTSELKSGKRVSDRLDIIKLVSETALELLRPLSYLEIMKVLADRLYMVQSDAILLVSEFEQPGSKLIVREVRATDKEKQIVMSMTGMSIESMSFRFPGETRNSMQPGNLNLLQNGISDLVFGQLPAALCKEMEEKLKIKAVYAMACTVDNDILGTVAILMHSGRLSYEKKVVIESIVGQASLALKRTRAEASLLESRQRYDSLFQNATIAIQHCKIITDENGNPVDYEMFRINNTLTRLTGITEEMVYGKTAREAFPLIKQTSFDFIDKFGKVAVEGGELVDEFHIPRLNRWFSVYAYSPRKGEFTAFFSDITQRKLYEAELREAKEKAEESDRLKTVFLANMSHEIRTPMNGIMGFAELLMESGLSGESQNRYLESINLSCRRMLNIINDLVAISMIESGQVRVTRHKTDLRSLLNEIMLFFRPEAVQKGISLDLKADLPGKEFFIETDKTKLYQSISNLIINALKFTRQGGRAELGCSLKNDDLLYFYVSDTGIGIREEFKEKIFDRFSQGDMASKHEGVGLGLAISKAYVEILGGRIGVESEYGKGSLFFFTLPV